MYMQTYNKLICFSELMVVDKSIYKKSELHLVSNPLKTGRNLKNPQYPFISDQKTINPCCCMDEQNSN
jgi:hypothetical protein